MTEGVGCILGMLRFMMCGLFGVATVMFTVMSVSLLIEGEIAMSAVLLIVTIFAGFVTYGWYQITDPSW